MKDSAKERLQWAHDQCPLPGSPIPSLHHTRWYAEGHNQPQRLMWQPDGYTMLVFSSPLFTWYRSFTIAPPTVPNPRSLFTVSEWLPRYQPRTSRGWFIFGNHYTSAYAKVHANYQDDWRSQAKRHLKAFQKSDCKLRLGTREDIVAIYATSQVPKHLQRGLLKNLNKRMAVHPHTIDILVAEKHGRPVACHVVGNCDEAKLSEYIIGAFDPDAKKDNPMVGLIDWWYRRSLERGYDTLTFGHIEPGTHITSMSGRGYSLFKTHFGVERIWFPRNYWQIKINHKGLFSKP